MLFNKKPVDAMNQYMFFGEPVNVSRYDQQRHPIFEKLIEKQLSFFWIPNEINITDDARQYQSLDEHEKHIFISNLKYQTLLDSIQGRGPNLALLPIASLPEVETWIETWCFSETIHSRSYTHILRNLVPNPSEFFDSIMLDENILKRAEAVTKYGDDLVAKCRALEANKHSRSAARDAKRALYLYVASTNILEAIRFYVSFACSFAFAERTLMEGNAKIIKLISRDEALHLNGTQHMLNLMRSGSDDPEMKEIAEECEEECIQMFKDAVQQEKDWSSYLFKDGSMIGLSEDIVNQYVEYIANIRMQSIGLKPVFEHTKNPIPWINSWLSSESTQVAPQESEISSYLVGQIDNTMTDNEFDDFDMGDY